MLLAEVIRGDYRAAATRGARPPLSASRYQLQNTPISSVPKQRETVRRIPNDLDISCESEVWR
jgi:hypothetical protein